MSIYCLLVCMILVLLNIVAVPTKLGAKIWFKFLESAYNNILP